MQFCWSCRNLVPKQINFCENVLIEFELPKLKIKLQGKVKIFVLEIFEASNRYIF